MPKTDKDLEKSFTGNEEGRKPYHRELFQLREKDFIAIGCSAEDIARVKEMDASIKKLKSAGDNEENRKEVDRLTEEKYAIFLKAADKINRSWEYRKSSMPYWIQCTGNVSAIDQFLGVYGDMISIYDKVKLLKRRNVTQKVKAVEIEAAKNAGKAEADHPEGIEVISNSENDAKITGIQQKGFQSSGAGCWSVSMQMLLQSRGVKNMSQTDIRSFRPNYNGKAIRELISPYKDLAPIEDDKKKKDKKQAELNEMARETFNIMESDKSSNALDRGEAFIKMAPGHMMKGVEIGAYGDEVRKLGITREEYLARTKEVVRKNILHAIKEDQSPVSFLGGGHYITIVGIDENNRVKYKDSIRVVKRNKKNAIIERNDNNPDAELTANLDDLIGRVVADVPRHIRMEWAAEMKLSQDGTKLYGVPSQYLTIGQDGSVMVPSELSEDVNFQNGYQNMEGNYVGRKNGSESPDEEKNREDYLAKGGVNINEMIYLPKTVNLDILKKKAERRSPEEEARLQQMSESYYGVKHEPGKFKTLAEMDADFDEKKTAVNAARQQKRTDGIAKLNNLIGSALAGQAPEAAPNNSTTRAYDAYILNLVRKTNKRMTYSVKQTLVNSIAASYMKHSGEKFDEKRIAAFGEGIKGNLCFDELNKEDMLPAINAANPVQAMDQIQNKVINELFGVEPKFRESYIKEMKVLANNMLTKNGRTTLYRNFYDAVDAASKIDLTKENAAEEIAKANRKIIETVKKYMKGKEKVRSSTDGNDRFHNALDALSVVSVFAPAVEKMEAAGIVERIHHVRGIDKLDNKERAKRKDLIILKNYGGERAKKRANEIKAEKQKKLGSRNNSKANQPRVN